MKKRPLAFLLALVFLLTLSPIAFATSGAAGTFTHEHVWSDWIIEKAPTCVKEGKRFCECSGCGQRYYEKIPMTEHSFGDWTVVKEASGAEPGYEERVCSYCGLTERRPLTGEGQGTPPAGFTTAAQPFENVCILKTVVNSPANGSYYTLGETVQFSIVLENRGDTTLLNVVLYDVIGTTEVANAAQVEPGGSLSGTFDFPIHEAEVAHASFQNYAFGTWVTAETGEAGNERSNLVMFRTGKEPSDAITVTKSFVNDPQNGMYFTPGETVAFEVVVLNTGSAAISNVTVQDPLAVKKAGSTVIGSFETLLPGESQRMGFDYTVTYADAAAGGFTNTASVTGTAQDGSQVTDDTGVFVPAGSGAAVIVVDKELVSAPANGQYYVPGEQADFLITVVNAGAVTADDLNIRDWPDYLNLPSFMLDTHFQLIPGESASYSYSQTVQQENLDAGWVGNGVEVFGSFADGSSAYACDYVNAPVGQALPDPVFTAPGGEGGYCRRSLGAATGDSLSAAQERCDEHAALAEQAAGLSADEALALWADAVNREYDELAARGSEGFAALVSLSRRAFTDWLESERAELTERFGPETAAQRLAALAQNQCALLCYLNGAPVEQRPDSYLAAVILPAAGTEAAACALTESSDSAHTEQEEALCAQHTALESAMLDALRNGLPPLAAFSQARLRWLNAMGAQADGESAAAAEQAAFVRLLAAQEKLLAVIYTEQPETVQELLMQSVRAHVLLRCA